MGKIFNTNDYHDRINNTGVLTTTTATDSSISGISAEELKTEIDALYLSGELTHTSPQTNSEINVLIDAKIVPFKTEPQIQNIVDNSTTDFKTATQIDTIINNKNYKTEPQIQTIIDNSITTFKNTTEINTLIDSKISLIPTVIHPDDEDADLLEEDVANNVVSLGKIDDTTDIVEINSKYLKIGDLVIGKKSTSKNLVYSDQYKYGTEGVWNAHSNTLMGSAPSTVNFAKGLNAIYGYNTASRGDAGTYYSGNVRLGVNIYNFQASNLLAVGYNISSTTAFNNTNNSSFFGRNITVSSTLINTTAIGQDINPLLSNSVYIGNDTQNTYVNKIFQNKQDGTGNDFLITDSEIETKINDKLLNSEGDIYITPTNITNNILLGKNIPSASSTSTTNIIIGNDILLKTNKSYEIEGQQLLDFLNNNIRNNPNNDYSLSLDANNETKVLYSGTSSTSNPPIEFNIPIHFLGESTYNSVTLDFGTVSSYSYRSLLLDTFAIITSNSSSGAYSYSSYLKDKNIIKIRATNNGGVIHIKKITFSIRIDQSILANLTNCVAIGNDCIINKNNSINIGSSSQETIINGDLSLQYNNNLICNKIVPTYGYENLHSHHPNSSIEINVDDVSFKQTIDLKSDIVNLKDKLIIDDTDINITLPIISTESINCISLECTEIIPKRIYLKTETIGTTIADFYIYFSVFAGGKDYRSIDGLIDRFTQNYIISSGSYNTASSIDAYSYLAPYIAYEKYHGSIYSFTLDKKDNGFDNVFLRSNGTPIYTNAGAEVNGGITLQYEREIKLRFIWDYVTSVGHFVILNELLGTVATYSSIVAAAAAPAVGITSILDSAVYTGSSYVRTNEYHFIPDSQYNNMIIIDDAGLTTIILPTTGLIVGTCVKIIIDRTDAIVLKTETGNKIYNYIYARSTDDNTGEITDGSIEIVMSGKHMSILAWSGTGWYINF
jgi:hypothetical protein